MSSPRNLDHHADCHASGAVPTAAFAVLHDHELTLCGHHLAIHKPALTDAGWDIIPAHTVTPGDGTGTETTGRHHALEGTE